MKENTEVVERDEKDPGETESPSNEMFTANDVSRLVKAQMAEFKKEMLQMFSNAKEPAKKAAEEEGGVTKASLQRQLLELQNSIAEEKAAKSAAILRNSVREVATSLGVSPQLIKPLLAVVVDSDKLAYVDEEGSPVFRGKFGDVVEIETGLKDFLKSADGVAFAPPKRAAGSAERSRGESAGSNGKKLSPEEVEKALLDLF